MMRATGKRTLLLALCIAAVLQTLLPMTAGAANAEQKTVRVGWYESTYCYHDQNGERRGIAYEYQRRVAAHTGWVYEYVEDSWPNLLQMLVNGELDLLSDVSYKEERAEQMLFSASAMGAESYYLYVDADNTRIDPDDLSTLTGKRVGVNKGSYQLGLLRDWAAKNRVSPVVVELTVDEGDAMRMLSRGEIDAYVSLDSFSAQEQMIPVTKIGASAYYFAVNKDRPDLLSELNSAMSALQDEDPYFNQRMFDQYVHARIEELMAEMNAHNAEALKTGGVVIACGMAKHEGDSAVAPVYERADQRMYEDKSRLKAMKNA